MTDREKEIRRLCEERNIRVERVGCAWRLYGAGVSLMVDSLARLTEFDLNPVKRVNESLSASRASSE